VVAAFLQRTRDEENNMEIKREDIKLGIEMVELLSV
jgi:hypothetical protein